MRPSELIFSTTLNFIIDSTVADSLNQQLQIVAADMYADYAKVVGMAVSNWDLKNSTTDTQLQVYSSLIQGNGALAIGRSASTLNNAATLSLVGLTQYTQLNMKHRIGRSISGLYTYTFKGVIGAAGAPAFGAPAFKGAVSIQLEFYKYV